MAPSNEDRVDVGSVDPDGNYRPYLTRLPASKLFAWSTVARAQMRAPGYHGEPIIVPSHHQDVVRALLYWILAVDPHNSPELSIAGMNALLGFKVSVNFVNLAAIHYISSVMGLVKHLKGNRMHNEFVNYVHDHRPTSDEFFFTIKHFHGVDDKVVQDMWTQAFFQYTKACINAPSDSEVVKTFDYIKQKLVQDGHWAKVAAMNMRVKTAFREHRQKRDAARQ